MFESNNERLALLMSMKRENPQDPFPPYAIALEYRAAGERVMALRQLQSVIETFPDYLPAYYPSIALHIEFGEPGKAIELAKIGIDLAAKQKNIKTAGEIKSLIELEIDDDVVDGGLKN